MPAMSPITMLHEWKERKNPTAAIGGYNETYLKKTIFKRV
jgi:hypothetical protein